MPRKCDPLIPVTAKSYFSDPVRSSMHPVLVAALDLAYAWSTIIGSDGHLTQIQLRAALTQISAYDIPIDNVVRDLLALNLLDDVGTGYQLPHTMPQRNAKAHAESMKNYHKRRKERKVSHETGAKSPHVAAGAGQATGSYSYTSPFAEEPVSGVRNVAPDEVRERSATGSNPGAQTDINPGPIPHASASAHRSENSSHTPTASEVRRSGSGSSSPKSAEQKQPQQSTQASAEAPIHNDAAPSGSVRDACGLDPEDWEVVEELLATINRPEVSNIEPQHRGRICTRQEYGPSARLLARWVLLMPMDQILKDLERYKATGNSDSIAVREHDSRYESFMSKGTMTYKHERMEMRVKAQRAMRQTLKRVKEQNRRAAEQMAANARAEAAAAEQGPTEPSTTPPPAPTPTPLTPAEEAVLKLNPGLTGEKFTRLVRAEIQHQQYLKELETKQKEAVHAA